jgi:hypothetical protein
MSHTVTPGYFFDRQEIPTEKTFLQQTRDMSVSEIPFSAFPAEMGRAWINGLWPAVGDGGDPATETMVSGASQEGHIVMDRGGHLWVNTRWGPTRFQGHLGAFETRRFPFFDTVLPPVAGVALDLHLPQSANDTSSTDVAWREVDGRTLGALMSTEVTSATVGYQDWNPRVALYGFVGTAQTGLASASEHRVMTVCPAYLGVGSFYVSGQPLRSTAGPVWQESTSRYYGNISTEYTVALGGIFFGFEIPVAGLAT